MGSERALLGEPAFLRGSGSPLKGLTKPEKLAFIPAEKSGGRQRKKKGHSAVVGRPVRQLSFGKTCCFAVGHNGVGNLVDPLSLIRNPDPQWI